MTIHHGCIGIINRAVGWLIRNTGTIWLIWLLAVSVVFQLNCRVWPGCWRTSISISLRRVIVGSPVAVRNRIWPRLDWIAVATVGIYRRVWTRRWWVAVIVIVDPVKAVKITERRQTRALPWWGKLLLRWQLLLRWERLL
jgi:hypothetical protein